VDDAWRDPQGELPLNRRLGLLLVLAAVLSSRVIFRNASASANRFPLAVGKSVLDVEIDGHARGLTDGEIRDWIDTSARGVAAYFGGFPVPHARVAVRVTDGRGVAHGRATPGAVPILHITLGSDATRRGLNDDWILVHEMIHLGFPSIEGPHEWMAEGLATYAEPLARLQNGTLTPERFWSDMVRDLPQGLPQAGESGFNATQSWASTYWGGALFWFLADVRIRETTGGKRGLADALHAVNTAGGNFNGEWSVDEVLRVADAEAGAPVLRELYEEWGVRAGSVDLDLLFRRLGVVSLSRVRGGIGFDDAAPLAAIRRRLTGR
jgi:hypothetical protein